MKRSKRWFLQIFINEIKNRLIPRNMYKTFELLRTSRSGFNQSSPNRREMMKTATYNVQTCDGTSQDITINYTIVPEPLSVIREWCEMNSFRSFDCIPENKMARDNFAWSYISHVENVETFWKATKRTVRMQKGSVLTVTEHLPSIW